MNTAECRIGTGVVRGKFRVYAVGDMHSDSLAFDEQRFKSYIAHIAKDPHCVVILVGDYVEGRVPGQRHFDPRALVPEARANIADYVKWCLDRSEQLLVPLKRLSGRVFVWAGNHDHYMEYSGFCAMLADRLKATYMGDEGMIRLLVNRERGKGGSHDVFTIYGTHGSGGAGLPGAKVNAMQRYMMSFDADVYVAGHVHDGMIRVQPQLGLQAKGSLQVVQRPKVLYRAPAFVRRAVTGVQTYASKKGYPTADDGLQYVESVTRWRSDNGRTVAYRDWQRHEFLP